MSSDRGEFPANGVKIKPKPPVVGVWDLAYAIGDRDVTAKLIVSQKPDGTLDAKWASQMGESTISNVKFENGKLTFDRAVKFNDREFKMTFEGTAQGDKLTGVSKSDMGEIPVTGTRFGGALIGKWELTTTTDQGTRTSTLTVYPDLTGRQEFFGGETPIKDLKLEGDQVTYVLELGFGDQTFVINYKLKLQGKTLTGQSSSERGTNEITGKKLEQAARGQLPRQPGCVGPRRQMGVHPGNPAGNSHEHPDDQAGHDRHVLDAGQRNSRHGPEGRGRPSELQGHHDLQRAVIPDGVQGQAGRQRPSTARSPRPEASGRRWARRCSRLIIDDLTIDDLKIGRRHGCDHADMTPAVDFMMILASEPQ